MGTEDYQAPPRSPERVAQPALVVVFPRPALLRVLPGGLELGRGTLQNAGIDDRAVSGRHAHITRRGPRFYIEDPGSHNGTWVDGVRIPHGERVGLDDGALIRVGGTLLVLREHVEGVAPGSWPAELATTYGLESVVREVDWLAARPPQAVLVMGKTGTGKEALSHRVAERLRPGKKVVTVNVAGIAETVFESDLFGHERGAYTGAVAAARGILETHNGGSVILDELGELPLALQPKLLRAIENQVVQPVGAAEPRPIDVLIIGATQRDLDADVAAGRFRADLLARFPVRIDLPPLRDRREDVFAVMQALAARRGEAFDPEQVHTEALERLILEPWPTNVRGLYAALESIARGAPPPALHLADVERVLGSATARPPLTREAVLSAIEACGGNKAAAAQQLGVSRGALYRALGTS